MTANAGHVFVSHGSDNRDEANELSRLPRGARDQGLDRAARRPARHGLFRAAAERDRGMPRLRRAGHRHGQQIALRPRRDRDGVQQRTSRSSRSGSPTSSRPPASPSSSRSATGPTPIGTAREASIDRLALELQDAERASARPRRRAAAPAATPPRRRPPPTATAAAARRAPPARPRPAAPPRRRRRRRATSWRAAIGPNADLLSRPLAADGRRRARRCSWNWAACLANLFWFAYRKMWVPMAAMGFVAILVSVIGLGQSGRRPAGAAPADRRHLRHRRVRQPSLPPADRPLVAGDRNAQALRAAGGVSLTGPDRLDRDDRAHLVVLIAAIAQRMSLRPSLCRRQSPRRRRNAGRHDPAHRAGRADDAASMRR